MQSIECEKMDQWREEKGQQDRGKTASRPGVSSQLDGHSVPRGVSNLLSPGGW